MPLVATQVKRRRGTGVENDAFAGAEGEITVDLTNKELRVHDGSGKTGGFRIGRNTDRTNCITEIPQDIKLELNNGTLTLKAGSKAYLPNGTIYNASQDIVLNNSQFGSATTDWVVAMTRNNAIFPRQLSNCVSGAGATTVGGYAYDTTTNIISWYNAQGSVGGANCSFPIAIIHTTSGTPDKIDQVFNGFGYIGKKMFILPDVKAIHSNGRNADGTLKNDIVTVNNVIISTGGISNNKTAYLILNKSGSSCQLTSELDTWTYDEQQNIFYYNNNKDKNWVFIGTYSADSNRITSFNIKTTFHALDYNDTGFIGHQSMPSNRYVDLTLGTSGATYTAPADGYYFVSKSTNSSNQYMNIVNTNTNFSTATNPEGSGANCRLFLPVSKGDVVSISYNASGATNFFRFIYAQGSK